MARVDTIGSVSISENPGIALASMACRLGCEAKLRAACKSSLGLDLPGPARMVPGAVWSAFWAGPDQWIVMAPFESHEDIAAELKSRVGGSASVTEQTDAWVRFDVAGEGLMDVFERLCPVNVRRMQPGDTVRTMIEHLGVFLLCHALNTFSVLGARSSARSLHNALRTAAVSSRS